MAAPEFEKIGPYPNPRFIAEGGMAWVFQVQDQRFQTRQLALKLLKPDAAQGGELRLFEREAELLAGISHPNLVTIFDSGRDEATGYFYYTMSYIEGPSLSQLLKERGHLSIKEAIDLTCGVLEGLEQLHERGIVHRDIKPGNILVDPSGRAVLMDLGIARVMPASDAGVTEYTRTDIIRGTPLYMSPEQSEGKAARAASDIFSVGLTLYAMLTGHTVYDDAPDVDSSDPLSVRDYLGHLRFGGGEFAMKFPKRIPRGVREATRRASRISPNDRFENAQEMYTALRGMVGESRSIRWGNWAAVLAAVALVGVAALLAVRWLGDTELTGAQASARVSAEALAGRVPDLVEGARNLAAPPAADLLEAADRSVERGRSQLSDARADEKAGESHAATRTYVKAGESFEAACQTLALPVGGGARSQAKSALERIDSLRAADADQVFPQRWSAFEGRAAGLAPAAADLSACDLLEHELARTGEAAATLAAAVELENSLGTGLRDRIEAIRDEVARARSRAETRSSPEPEYKAALAAGRRAFRRGDAARARDDLRGAQKAYHEASTRFDSAENVVLAFDARTDSRLTELKFMATGSTPPPKIVRMINDADAHYDARRYEEATKLYETSIAMLNKRKARSALGQGAVAERPPVGGGERR